MLNNDGLNFGVIDVSVIFPLFACLFLAFNVYAGELFKSRVTIEGVVVSPACNVEVESDGVKGGVSFGRYNLSNSEGVVEKNFFIKIYEHGSLIPGCRAFLTGNDFVRFSFGDKSTKQLDEHGVITKGAGDSIRIVIRALDSEANNREKITHKNAVVQYPKKFAREGIFRFSARLGMLDHALSGDYYGSLSLVISYQ